MDPAAVRDGGAAAVSGAPNDLFRPGDPHYCQLYDRAGGNLKINKKNNQLTELFAWQRRASIFRLLDVTLAGNFNFDPSFFRKKKHGRWQDLCRYEAVRGRPSGGSEMIRQAIKT